MFDDVPDILNNLVASMSSRSDAKTAPYSAAECVISYYLDANFSDISKEPFMLSSTVGSQLEWMHLERKLNFGFYLFNLRSEPDFDEFCERLKQENWRAAFYELAAASFFAGLGYRINAVNERRSEARRGENFDFGISRGAELIDVEVRSFEKVKFDPKTVMNAFKKKRTQVSGIRPAVKVFFYPAEWRLQIVNLDHELKCLSLRHFGNSKKLNVVLFVEEKFHQPEKNLTISSYRINNVDARHQSLQLKIDHLNEICGRNKIIIEREHLFFRSMKHYFDWVTWATSDAGIN